MKDQEALQIFDRLGHLHQAYLREFSYNVGLNLRQLECLIYLRNCNRYSNTPLALSEYLGLTKGTVSQTIISLEDKGLLKKETDAGDRRITHLTLTRKAEKIVAQCTEHSPLQQAFADPANETASHGNTLLKILQEVQRANNSKTFGACYTCSHFRRNGLGSTHQCGLTKEPLSEDDSTRICREHAPQ